MDSLAEMPTVDSKVDEFYFMIASTRHDFTIEFMDEVTELELGM